ncbi:M20/M25/M40 family metallo-hydrolase [Microbacterium sp. G2-8]|uniref:M20/M25/M40 family metallo-hydrolase n=1 Tax=Microbacterium sp. G2-8 TaxID=2842454 RepID=UPI001C8A7CD2|nr:M20/M25/M40 family metallo-hydrolase [Microbacterium sp. G2-8]
MDDADVPPIAGRLAKMVRLQTVSAEVDVRGSEPFEQFVELLAELYPLVHEHLHRERITDLGVLFRWRGTGDGDPVVLMAHYDVVPASADAWSEDPFAGVVRDGWVHGRGTLDDKGPLLVILEAVEALLSAGFAPARDVYLSFGGDEEVYGAAARSIAGALDARGIRPWLVMDEGGAVVDAPLPFISGRAAMIGVGEKGVVTLRIEAQTDAGHASAPSGKSAIDRIARAVSRLDARTFVPRAPATITRMLAAFAAVAAGPARTLLRVLSRSRLLTGWVLSAMGGEPAALVRTTIAATMQSGGSAANVLPSAASATLNLRLIPGDTVDSVVRRVKRRIADRRVIVTVLEGSDPTPLSPADGSAFAAIADAVHTVYPDALAAPYLMMQASDARHFHAISPHVFRFAPLEMSATQRASIHGADERVEIASLERGRDIHIALLRSLT